MPLAPRQKAAATGILSYFTRHRTASNLLLLTLLVLGFSASTRIRSQFFPDVIINSIAVIVEWPGAGPEDVDHAIVEVLEPALLSVEGVESTASTAHEGWARLAMDFEPGWDMARAADDVKSAVDSVRNLPENASDPEIRRGAWRDRVTDVVISGPVSRQQLGRFADEFSARLFRAGITRTTIRGVAAPVIRVEVPEASLIRNDVSLREIADAIAQEAEADPAGDVAGGTSRVRTGIEKRSAEEVAGVVIRSEADGAKLRVSDVAEVVEEGAESGRIYFKGGMPAVSIRVDRSERGDAVVMQHKVEAVAAALQPLLPEGVKVELIRTRAEAITGRLNILFDNGLLGLGLVLGLLFLFLSARTAFWVAAGIPVAMFATVALMFAFGLTLNMLSLFALIITLGIVVDDAIVVGEHADFRARRLGEAPVAAAENAAIRMAPPVFSSTITTVLAFFSLTAISGRFGDLIADIPFTVSVVLLASLTECFLILPNHMTHALAARQKDHWYDAPCRIFNVFFRWFRDQVFRRLMTLVLFFRYPVLAGAVLLLATMVAMFIRGDVNWRFFNAPERGSIFGNFAMLNGATRDDTQTMVRELQRAVDVVGGRYEKEYGANPVTFALAQIGGTTGRGLSGVETKDKDLLGAIAIELIDADLRPYSSFAFLAALQDEVRNHPLLETLSFRGYRSGPGGDALDVELFGADANVLKSAAEALKAAVARFPEVSAVEDSLAYDKTELVLDLTPQGRSLGFTIDGVGKELYQRLNGIDAAEFPVGSRTGKIQVALPQSEMTADFLQRTLLRSAGGGYVPLSDIVTVTSKLGFSTVRRQNGLRLISVTGDISEDDPARAELITETLRDEILPLITEKYGVDWRLAGLSEQENTFLEDALFGFSLALAGIYLTLSWIFSSWTRPIVVMSIIPFGLVGTIWGHHVWEVPLSMFSVVGMIGMTGIIINDSIVLVTTVDEYADRRGTVPAVIDAAVDRLRAVLLTSLTTVLGLAPLLYESSRQAQFLKPTVITLCYGLGFGVVLVLLVVPSLLVVQLDVARLLRSVRRALAGRHIYRPQRLVLSLAAVSGLCIVLATVGYFALTGTLWRPAEELAVFLPAALSGGARALALLLAGLLATALAAAFLFWLLALAVGPRRGKPG
ncbi:MAG: efflux RND transporter permease subunit [Paracoccaceae bacterium]